METVGTSPAYPHPTSMKRDDPLRKLYEHILKTIDDPELRETFLYTFAELRLANLTPQETELVQKLLSLALKNVKVGQDYDVDLRGASEFILSDVVGIIIPTRSRKGFERRLQATEIKEIRESLLESERAKRKGLMSWLIGGGE